MSYQRGKIYKIVCNTTGLTYYGSTIEPTLARRLSSHNINYNAWKKGLRKYMTTSGTILENNNYEIVLVELYPCNSKDELHKRERFYIENNECVNKFIPTRTDHEYYEDHKEEKKEYNKKYNEEHKQEINEKYKKYKEEHKEEIIARHKKYREEHRQEINAKQIARRKAKKENKIVEP
jgi:hypothetical protein